MRYTLGGGQAGVGAAGAGVPPTHTHNTHVRHTLLRCVCVQASVLPGLVYLFAGAALLITAYAAVHALLARTGSKAAFKMRL